MSDQDDPSGGNSLEKEIGQDEFLAPPGVKAGWIYRLKKSELMELAVNLQIIPEELPKSRERSTSPSEVTGNYSSHINRHDMGAVLRREFSCQPPPQPNVSNPWMITGIIPPIPEMNMTPFQELRVDGKGEAIGFLKRLEGILETKNIPKQRTLPVLPELSDGKALLWYRSNEGSWTNRDTFKEIFRMAFYPVHYREDLELAISRRIRRYNETAIDYIIDIQTMIHRHGSLTPEKETLRILRNLLPEYHQYIRRMDFWDNQTLVSKIMEYEMLREETVRPLPPPEELLPPLHRKVTPVPNASSSAAGPPRIP
ncbi:hypothetical protein JTB14_023986 [Gonioctena quinquepunctata]|nr:hypothetical protein JTB14_023986 [Gonioctena quinquepunctata]